MDRAQFSLGQRLTGLEIDREVMRNWNSSFPRTQPAKRTCHFDRLSINPSYRRYLGSTIPTINLLQFPQFRCNWRSASATWKAWEPSVRYCDAIFTSIFFSSWTLIKVDLPRRSAMNTVPSSQISFRCCKFSRVCRQWPLLLTDSRYRCLPRSIQSVSRVRRVRVLETRLSAPKILR